MIYRETKIKMRAGVFSEIMQVIREWYGIFNLQNEKRYDQHIILHPAKIFFKNYGEIKAFKNKQKFREFAF